MEQSSGRRIGLAGTVSRVVIGALMVGSVAVQGVGAEAWLVGGVVMPALLILWQAMWVRLHPRPIRAVGPVGHAVTLLVFLILYLTPDFAPTLSFTRGAALVFFGGSMLIAAVRGYRGCEVLALSNWILRRDDQVGCVLFSPIDRLESARRA